MIDRRYGNEYAFYAFSACWWSDARLLAALHGESRLSRDSLPNAVLP